MKDLIKYTAIADRKVIGVFDSISQSVPEAERLFSHLLNAQHIWISRINNVQPHYQIFQVHEKEQFADLHRKNFTAFSRILNQVDLNSPIEYTTFKGESFINSVTDILYQVITHSTYHRAQIASQFRMNGIEPPVTDYIFLKRQGEF